jgi:hypothetical protein
MDGYSAITPEDIAMLVQNYGIKNNKTYKEFTKAKKRVTKKSYKKELQKREKQVGMANIT